MTDPTPTPPQLDRISHNHGPNVGPGLACREHRTGDCIIRELTARAEAAEAKIAAVRELHTKTYVSVDNEVWGRDPRCSECHDAYPCSTIAALDGTA